MIRTSFNEKIDAVNMATDLDLLAQEESDVSAEGIISSAWGQFFVFEGIDGSGKTTVARQVYERIEQEVGPRVVLTAEPTDTWMGDCVRRGNQKRINALSEALLFLADRAEHTLKIRGWLSEDMVVVCDRYNASTIAYQGAMLGDWMGDQALGWLKKVSAPTVIPADLTFLLKVSPDRAMERINHRSSLTRFERLEFLERVAEIYDMLADEDPDFMVIDATQPLESVVNDVMSHILRKI